QFEIPWKNSPHQTQIALNRLTRRQVGDWIKRGIGRKDVSDSLLGAILERTDGIPLFIEEFTKVLSESGALESKTLPESTSDWFKVIPTTLNDLLMARLDIMSSEKEVIQIASAIGREFSFELLSAASTHSVVDLTMEIEKLVKAEIVFQKGTGSNALYIFKHALLQDAAYRSMLSKKRQSCHQRIAKAIEEQFPSIVENQPELLAQHYGEASMPQQAIDYWTKAGQRAQSRSQNQEAIEHYRQGLAGVSQMSNAKNQDPKMLAAVELGLTVPLGVSLLAAKGYASPEAGP
ncbi:MAG: ATP-binding protein, partial [Pirellula sp.]